MPIVIRYVAQCDRCLTEYESGHDSPIPLRRELRASEWSTFKQIVCPACVESSGRTGVTAYTKDMYARLLEREWRTDDDS